MDTFDRIGQTASLTVFVDTTAPDAPTGLRLDGAVLHWDPAADANGIWKYQVRVDGGEWSETFLPQARTNLHDGAGGLCEVRAVDKAGNVGPATAATLAPDYGPQVVSHDVESVMGLVESFTVTFNEAIDSSTLTADDVRILLPTPTLASPGYAPGGYVDDVIFAGTRVYVVAGSTVHILDVSGPSASLLAPQYLGEVDIPLGTTSGGISGTLMYLTLGADGLQLVDLSDPSSPVWMPVYDVGGWALESSAFGTRLYVMVKDRGLVILDVSDPASPALLGRQEISDELEVAAGPGSLVYLSDEEEGVYIVDASNPSAPTLLSHYDTFYDVDNVTVYGTQAYLVDGDTGLHILDVSNPLSPVLLGSYDDGGYVEALAVSGTLAFLAIEDHGLQILDVSGPSSPVLLGIYDTEDPCGVAVSGEVVYVPDGAGGLVILEMMQKVAGVTAVDATTYRIDLEGELPDGEYRVFFGPDVIDQAGNTMDQDSDGIGGQASDTYAFIFTSSAPGIVKDRHVFYNNSAWDGYGLSADAADDAAIASDKQALLPYETATFANYTSYSRGINGIMVDIAALSGALTAADFALTVGNSSDLSSWTEPAGPVGVTIRPGQGIGGSDRVTIIWADNAIQNEWLQVTVLSDAHGGHAGLAKDDVFCFGNAVGECGNSTSDTVVDESDVAGARSSPHGPFNRADIDDAYDYNRDRLVNATDIVTARDNQTTPSTSLQLITAPMVGGAGSAPEVLEPVAATALPVTASLPVSSSTEHAPGTADQEGQALPAR